MWSFNLSNWSLDWNGEPLLWYSGMPYGFEIGTYTGSPINIADYPGIAGFTLNAELEEAVTLTRYPVQMVVTLADLEAAFAEDTSVPYDIEVTFGINDIYPVEFVSASVPVMNGTLIYFNTSYKMQTKPIYDSVVVLEDWSFVAGVVKDGQRVTPETFEGLTELEIYAITGQFFDLNTILDSDFRINRTLTLNNLRSIYGGGSPIQIDNTVPVSVSVANMSNPKPIWVASRPEQALGLQVNQMWSNPTTWFNVAVSLNRLYYDGVKANVSETMLLNHVYFKGLAEAVPFESMESFTVAGLAGASYDSPHFEPADDQILTFGIFGVWFYTVRKTGFVGTSLDGLYAMIDVIGGSVTNTHGVGVGARTGYRPLKNGYCQIHSHASIGYSSDFEEIKALAIAEKTRLGI